MRLIIINNAVIKGYHEFQIRPPPSIFLPVTKEYGNNHDPHSCLVWVPDIDKIPKDLWNYVTDEKRGEIVQTIAGLPIGRVPRGLSKCFWFLLENPAIDCIECEQTGSPCKSFDPWPPQHAPGGGAVIPCSYRIQLNDSNVCNNIYKQVEEAVQKMEEKTVLQINLY